MREISPSQANVVQITTFAWVEPPSWPPALATPCLIPSFPSVKIRRPFPAWVRIFFLGGGGLNDLRRILIDGFTLWSTDSSFFAPSYDGEPFHLSQWWQLRHSSRMWSWLHYVHWWNSLPSGKNVRLCFILASKSISIQFALVKTCPGESIFDPMIGICVAAANASCLNRKWQIFGHVGPLFF